MKKQQFDVDDYVIFCDYYEKPIFAKVSKISTNVLGAILYYIIPINEGREFTAVSSELRAVTLEEVMLNMLEQ